MNKFRMPLLALLMVRCPGGAEIGQAAVDAIRAANAVVHPPIGKKAMGRRAIDHWPGSWITCLFVDVERRY